MARRLLYCFMHIPKTGGSTINRQLRNYLSNEEYVHLRRYGNRPRANVDMFAELPAWKRKRTRIMSGHYLRHDAHELVPKSDPRYFTIIRDPADRVLSVYNFQVHRDGLDVPFERWVEDYRPNVAFDLIRFCHDFERRDPRLEERIHEALSAMWFVGVTEHLDDDLPYLFTHLGVPNTWTDQRRTADSDRVEQAGALPKEERWRLGNPVQRTVEMTDEIRRQVHARNPLDLKLHRWAVRLRERKLADLRDVGGGDSAV